MQKKENINHVVLHLVVQGVPSVMGGFVGIERADEGSAKKCLRARPDTGDSWNRAKPLPASQQATRYPPPPCYQILGKDGTRTAKMGKILLPPEDHLQGLKHPMHGIDAPILGVNRAHVTGGNRQILCLATVKDVQLSAVFDFVDTIIFLPLGKVYSGGACLLPFLQRISLLKECSRA